MMRSDDFPGQEERREPESRAGLAPEINIQSVRIPQEERDYVGFPSIVTGQQ
jgi:hypothetical protein